jgi:uncharacterized hydrophobic protein (TIGR00271 family)
MNILDRFRLVGEKEDFDIVNQNIVNGIEFRGTNLWILIFAIFIASLGLNVNSTAVIIGAMLVSPLMGPIIGLGFSMAINDLQLLKKAIFSYLFASVVGLITSTIFFFLSPLNEAHSEILSRISPNIYDVLIALFGGLAGILAISSRLKGNVIPGVAIATALMPPLCTAGYGLATQQFSFFFGALYLFLINTVFIALATLITTRFLKFPFKHLPKKEDEHKANRIVWLIVVITFLPSVYFGYELIQQNTFQKRANKFIETEAKFPNDYLLKKVIDAENKTITLTYGGQIIDESAIQKLKDELPKYELLGTTLTIQQGFAYLQENKNNQEINKFTQIIDEKENIIQNLQKKLETISTQTELGTQVKNELIELYPNIELCIIQATSDNSSQNIVIKTKTKFKSEDKQRIENWLKLRLKTENLNFYFD